MFSSAFFKENKGLFCLILAQLCVSISIVTNKYLLTHTSSVLVLTLRFILSGLFLLAFLKLRAPDFSFQKVIAKLSVRDRVSLIVQGLLGGFLFNILMISGLQFTTATMAGIVASILPALVLILSYLILKEKIRIHEFVSITVAMVGIIFINLSKISIGGFSLNFIGDLLILLALFPEALYTIVAKLYSVDMCPIEQSTLLNIINAGAFIVTVLLMPGDLQAITHLSIFDWFLIIAVLTFAGLMFFILWNMGLSKATTQQAGIVTAVVPAGACILAVIFLNERVYIYEIIGIALVMTAIYIGAKESSLDFIKRLFSYKKSKNCSNTNIDHTDLDQDLITE